MNAPLTIDDTVKKLQVTASDPALSAWVGANAGSGKTFVLSRRVIRLLLAGADPAKILCLTFTKAAAAEMSDRVFTTLAKWTTASDADLRAEIAELSGIPPSAAMLAEARRLFALALETPGGLKIQTIHAFCERLLHRFPVEANVAGHFEVLDDAGREQLLLEAERGVLLEIADNPSGALAAALSQAIAHSSDAGYRKALRTFLEKQRHLMDWIEREGGIDGAIGDLRRHFNIPADGTATGIRAEMLLTPYFPSDYLTALTVELEKKGSFSDQLERLKILVADNPLEKRHEAHLSFFLTKDRNPRAHRSFLAASLFESFGDLAERLAQEQERLGDLIEKEKALAIIDATRALLTLGVAVAENYTARKAATGTMDFDDLIEKAASLLEKPAAAAWVHYKLDRGLDHILVDEAQDTSPRQWDVVRHLADEFFVGESARPDNRTLFAVGDEKQSIYSFQGASPEKFGEMRRHFEKRASEAAKRFERIALSLSFRSTSDVLDAVDLVCGQEEIKAFLTRDYVDHTAARRNQPGFVELWPPFADPPKIEHDGKWWQPLDRLDEKSGKIRLAARIAVAIRTMIEQGERLHGTGKPVRAGDILILTRKRGAQVDAIDRALKAEGVAVAGSDRLKLMDNIAVLDLLALADFALLSEDDLALAGLLKSPLVGLAEEALFSLAHNRPGTLWNELFIRGQKGEQPYADAYRRLDRWRREADFVPPFDFFLRVLSRDGGREAFLAALGRETDEVLEAFLAEVLAFERSEAPVLQGFVAWFRNGAIEIKRDLEAARDEVRVMTVHGAKGLEAPVVFLVDGGKPFHPNHRPDLLGLGENNGPPFIWKGQKEQETSSQTASLAREETGALAEYYRLLYVAMTRARDRLYIATTANEQGGISENSWFSVARRTLVPHAYCTEIADDEGNIVSWRWQKNPPLALAGDERAQKTQTSPERPHWLQMPAPAAKFAAKTLAPSRNGGFGREIGGDTPPFSPLARNDAVASPTIAPAERGMLIHRLLERLPAIAPSLREDIARVFIQDAMPSLDAENRDIVIAEALGVLEDPGTAFLFASGSARTETPVCGTLTLQGETFHVRGEVDRLIVTHDSVHIVDFKTNRTVPSTAREAPLAFIRQLALYRALLAPLFPGKTVEASLLWTNGPVLMTLSEELLLNALPTF